MHELAIESEHNKPLFKVVNTTSKHDSMQSIKVIDHIHRRVKIKKRFYSIEVSNLDNLQLNFNEFTIKPLFTSVTWFKDNTKMENESEMPAVQLIHEITSTPTVLHLTCSELNEMKLDKLLDLNIHNILALRGGNFILEIKIQT